jgi:predicted RNase H-like HicB family nuclease
MLAAQFGTAAEGRRHFKNLLDAAEEGIPASVQRESRQSAVVDADRLRHALTRLRPSHAQVVAEAGGWSVFIPGLPIAVDGADLDEALDEMVAALREYSEDWADHLRHAPNHQDNWALVQIVALGDDQQVKDWLVAH